MSGQRTAIRRRRQLSSNNAHLSGLGVPRYPGHARAKEDRIQRLLAKRKR